MQDRAPSTAPSGAAPRTREVRARRALPLYGINVPARPTPEGTIFLLLSLLLAWGTGRGASVSDILFPVAVCVGVGLAASFWADLQHGVYNLVRTDVLMLVSLYGLLYLEFLFPQPDTGNVPPELVKEALNLSLIAFGCLAAGRHLINMDKPVTAKVFTRPVAPRFFFLLFWFCFIVGYFHQWFAVKFNPLEWIEAMMGPRFSQPWGRGRLGDWRALLVELGALLYLIPPLGAIIIARPHRYGFVQRLMAGLAVLMVIFTFFCGGTRGQFIVAVFSFVMGYCYFRQIHPRRFAALVIAMVVFIPLISQTMLTFREQGLSNYINLKLKGYSYAWEEKSLFVDYNMVSLANLVGAVPDRQPFVGANLYYYMLIRPIPRAIWKGKPDAGGEEINAALAEEGAALTYSVTYIGEAWMAYGWFSVIGMSLFFGALSCWWNRFVTLQATDLAITIFASGMLIMLISMRSFLGFMTTVLPTLFLVIAASWFMGETAPRLLHLGEKGRQGRGGR